MCPHSLLEALLEWALELIPIAESSSAILLAWSILLQKVIVCGLPFEFQFPMIFVASSSSLDGMNNLEFKSRIVI